MLKGSLPEILRDRWCLSRSPVSDWFSSRIYILH